MIRLIFKRTMFILALVAVLPLVILTKLEEWLAGRDGEVVFKACIEILSICPTVLGSYLRKAYYWAVCTEVSPDTHFIFGSWLAHRDNVVRKGVALGAYTFIGYADIGENVLFGARVSVISGKYQHGRPEQRAARGDVVEEDEIIRIGKNSWIGQDVVIMANIGENCTVGAGSVVLRDVPDNTTVMGNPARKVNV